MLSTSLLMRENEEYTWQYKLDLVLDGDNRWWMSSYDYNHDYGFVPFWFPKGVYITVDWDDGTVETIEGISDGVDYGLNIPKQLFHQYAENYRYPTISITSRQWDKIWLCAGDPGNGGEPSNSYYHYWVKHSAYIPTRFYKEMDYYDVEEWFGFDYDSGCDNTIQGLLAGMRMSCIEIMNPLPRIAGILISDVTKVADVQDCSDMPYVGFFDDDTIYQYGTFVQNSMFYAFGYYFRLKNAPSNLFCNNLNAVDFTNCLWETQLSGINYPFNKDRMWEPVEDESDPYH